ncbi:MAG TPA: hypothetical protein VMS08_00725 [Candidatus Saccharimonadia bacterium]|nr:hypothetical protein [Candidatus Saccharimonadia bacterium]
MSLKTTEGEAMDLDQLAAMAAEITSGITVASSHLASRNELAKLLGASWAASSERSTRQKVNDSREAKAEFIKRWEPAKPGTLTDLLQRCDDLTRDQMGALQALVRAHPSQVRVTPTQGAASQS